MNSQVDYLIGKYRRKGILVDINLLLLYFIGTFRMEEIKRFKRTNTFVPDDYYALSYVLEEFEKVITTPNILTEVSNLSGQLGEGLKFEYFSYFTQQVELLIEEYTHSVDIARMQNFYIFGLTDLGIVNLTRERYLVLTDDLKLIKYLEYVGIDALNFNHIRTYFWT